MAELSREVKTAVTMLARELSIVTSFDVTGELCDECKNCEDVCDAGCREMELTLAVSDDGETWAYQTGDNSYFGSCYLLPNWYSTTVAHDADRRMLTAELIEGLGETI
jgi:ferredoxin